MIRQSQNFLTQVYALFDFVFVIIVFLFSWWLKFESGWMTFSFEAFKIMQVHALSFLLLLSILFIFKEVDISRAFLGLFLVNNLILASNIPVFCQNIATTPPPTRL